MADLSKKFYFPIWSGSFAESVDNESTRHSEIKGLELMESAGLAVAEQVLALCSPHRKVITLAGKGNNGGDAIVAAIHLSKKNINVKIIIVEPPQSSSCKLQMERAQSIGIPIESWTPNKISWPSAAIIIDGFLGLGVRGQLRESDIKACLEEANKHRGEVFAIDLPSGLDPDCWKQGAPPLPANHTVTFGQFKPAHVHWPTKGFCGNITVRKIGFAEEAISKADPDQNCMWQLLDQEKIIKESPFQQLASDSHKYDRGHVLVIGGSPGKYGAPLITAMGALRTGAGWATIALPEKITPIGQHIPPEITFEPFFTNSKLDIELFNKFVSERKVSSVVLGPGTLKQFINKKTVDCFKQLQEKRNIFIVIDAGALHGIGDLLSHTPLNPELTLLTPHPGEWRKLSITRPVPEPDSNPKNIKQIYKDLLLFGTTAIYKNAAPIVFDPKLQKAIVNNNGRLCIAKAGTGDLLAGIAAAHGKFWSASGSALRAQALIYHAAKIEEENRGPEGVLPTDLLQRIGI